MAETKSFDDEAEQNYDESGSNERTRRWCSLSRSMKEAKIEEKWQTILLGMEPFFRKVVKEEVERIVAHNLHSPQRCLQMPVEEDTNPPPPTLKLVFKRPPSTPVFTGGKVQDVDGNPLQLLLLPNTSSSSCSTANPGEEAVMLQRQPCSTAGGIKVELVALDGDFPSGDDWSSGEFEQRVVRQRAGKRPLLVGEVAVTLTDGSAVVSELSFTDNSSWTKSGRFRIGARVSAAGYRGERIREAVTEAFKVKDHRGESYKKHHPPALGDAVWRLVKIGKGGVFHRRLAAAQINTVQDFLIKFHLDPLALRKILGRGMSDRTWESTTGHAKTCDVGDGLFLHRRADCDLLLNPVFQVVSVVAGANAYTPHHLLNGADKVYIQNLAREAYNNWGNLEEYTIGSYSNANNNIVSLHQDPPMPQAAADEGDASEDASLMDYY